MKEWIGNLWNREEYVTGIARGFKLGLAIFGAAALSSYLTTSDWAAALITGGVTLFIAWGGRGGVESTLDARRNDAEADGP